MIDLDPTRQIDIHRLTGDAERVVVRVPLAVGSETEIGKFILLARTVGADVRAFPEGTFLLVTVPVSASREETAELLDGALRVLDEATALAATRDSAAATTEQYIRDWWDSRKSSPPGNAAPD